MVDSRRQVQALLPHSCLMPSSLSSRPSISWARTNQRHSSVMFVRFSSPSRVSPSAAARAFCSAGGSPMKASSASFQSMSVRQLQLAVFLGEPGREAHVLLGPLLDLELLLEAALEALERLLAVQAEAVVRHDELAQVGEAEALRLVDHVLELLLRDVVLQDVVEVRLAGVGDWVVQADDEVETSGALHDAVLELLWLVRGREVDDVVYLRLAVQQREQGAGGGRLVALAHEGLYVLDDGQDRAARLDLADAAEGGLGQAAVRDHDHDAVALHDVVAQQADDGGLAAPGGAVHQDAALVQEPGLLEQLLALPEGVDLVEDELDGHARQAEQGVRGELHLGQEPAAVVVVDLVDSCGDGVLGVADGAVQAVALGPVEVRLVLAVLCGRALRRLYSPGCGRRLRLVVVGPAGS